MKYAKYFIPTLYFIEGLPYTLVNTTSAVVLKSLGASNEFIGLSSILSLPWMLKFIWAPLVDAISNKKKWVIATQLMIAALLMVVALSFITNSPVFGCTAALAILAIVSATQDIAIDGYYLEILDSQQQAFYVGIRNTFYRLAMLFAGGLLVFFAGSKLVYWGVQLSWCCTFAITAALVFIAALFHRAILPEDAKRAASNQPIQKRAAFLPVLRSYLDQPGIAAIIIYILTFRLGDALMLKMAQPFLLDERLHGGLGLSISAVGIIYGTAGTAALLLGGIAGSCLIARDGLKRWLMPFALMQNLSIPLYFYLAIVKPGIAAVAIINFIEQAAYGLGVTAFTVFILRTVKPDHRAAHYAIATALMAAGMLFPSAISGFLQVKLGYSGLFLLSSFAAIPGLVSILFLPLTEKQKAA